MTEFNSLNHHQIRWILKRTTPKLSARIAKQQRYQLRRAAKLIKDDLWGGHLAHPVVKCPKCIKRPSNPMYRCATWAHYVGLHEIPQALCVDCPRE